jgi:hypothetical protein
LHADDLSARRGDRGLQSRPRCWSPIRLESATH